MGYDGPMHVRISARLLLILTAILLSIAADSAKALSHPEVSGKEAKRWLVPESQDVVRFRINHEINLPMDGYAVVRVDGDKIMAPVVGDNRTFGVYPSP